MRFDIAGLDGPGMASLDIELGPRPGPPVIVGWLLLLGVSAMMIAALALAWWRIRSARLPWTWVWG